MFISIITNLFTRDIFDYSHGTRCAGEIAAKRGNKICGVGIAYDSKIAGKYISEGE